MRALVTAMIVMGVLIVLGVITLVGGIVHRMNVTSLRNSMVISEPAGSHIVSIASPGPDRLALHLQGGGPERVDIIDLRDGRTVSRLVIAP